MTAYPLSVISHCAECRISDCHAENDIEIKAKRFVSVALPPLYARLENMPGTNALAYISPRCL